MPLIYEAPPPLTLYDDEENDAEEEGREDEIRAGLMEESVKIDLQIKDDGLAIIRLTIDLRIMDAIVEILD
ncbi:hypothetical protein SOVF_205250 [Spinacia oleracea]|nr:hypothetical protein SOVF_205250 [Spinacia oleracea]